VTGLPAETKFAAPRWHRQGKLDAEATMRNLAVAIAAFALIGASSTAFADTASFGSMQQALYVARDLGVVGFEKAEFDDGKWQIEGRDPTGRHLEIEVDARTGGIIKVDHWR
jgi:hypothetical protein